jgi:hypothetical protein
MIDGGDRASDHSYSSRVSQRIKVELSRSISLNALTEHLLAKYILFNLKRHITSYTCDKKTCFRHQSHSISSSPIAETLVGLPHIVGRVLSSSSLEALHTILQSKHAAKTSRTHLNNNAQTMPVVVSIYIKVGVGALAVTNP